jgi:hypothetical protein
MPQELLDGPNVVAGLEEVGGERVTQGVGRDVLGDVGDLGGLVDGALEDALVEMVASDLAGLAIGVRSGGGKDPLPRPGAREVGVLSAKGIGELDAAGAATEVGLVLRLSGGELVAQGLETRVGERGDAIAAAFGVADDDFAAVEIEVFDAKGGALEEAQAGAVEERRHQVGRAAEIGEERRHLLDGEDDGQPLRAARVKELAERLERLAIDTRMEKQERREGLILGGRADPRLGEADATAAEAERDPWRRRNRAWRRQALGRSPPSATAR